MEPEVEFAPIPAPPCCYMEYEGKGGREEEGRERERKEYEKVSHACALNSR